MAKVISVNCPAFGGTTFVVINQIAAFHATPTGSTIILSNGLVLHTTNAPKEILEMINGS